MKKKDLDNLIICTTSDGMIYISKFYENPLKDEGTLFNILFYLQCYVVVVIGAQGLPLMEYKEH